MKRLSWFTLVLLAAGSLAQPASVALGERMKLDDRLVGAWKLVEIEEPAADGNVQHCDCEGMFVFTSDGKASVQVMYRNPKSGSAYAQAGYEASYGTYHIDEDSTFTFHVDGAIVRKLIGQDLKRTYAISGNRLTVTPADPKEHWKVIWERF